MTMTSCGCEPFGDEDQQLGLTVDGRLHRVPDRTIPAGTSPTSRAGRLSTTWPSPPGSVDRVLGDLLPPRAGRWIDEIFTRGVGLEDAALKRTDLDALPSCGTDRNGLYADVIMSF
jgi:hypothetical protein